ncbi:DASH complex subunit Dad3-domain-containing protein [Nemania diffusa]|nr:DASH complex subunit Dad3-domain-containing protein [Nemania diffusa]
MDQAIPNPLLSPPDLSPLEQEVLEEYERLAENMKKVRNRPSPSSSHSSKLHPARRNKAYTAPRWTNILISILTNNPHAQFASILDDMASRPTTEILDGLRELERKTSLVFTLLKASVYSIVLQQEIDFGEHHDGVAQP